MKLNKGRFLIAGGLAALGLLVAGCPGSEDPLESCEGITCGDHGECDDSSGEAVCVCDEGYHAENMICVEDDTGKKRTGEECTDSGDCQSGWCLKYTGQDTGYCSLRDCQGNDACVNYGADDAEMCCVDVGGDYFICMKIGEGCSCGDQSGMCGASCACQMDSACDPSQACLSTGPDDPNAVCAHECTTDADCNDCENPEDPDDLFTCQPISGGVTYCLGGGETPCTSSLDCEGDDVCFPMPTPDETDLEGTCGQLGDLPIGADCNDEDNPNDLPQEQRCAGFYCMNDHCSAVCEFEADCPDNMVCGTVNFQMDEAGNEVASIGMCIWMEGSLDDCGGNADCPAGEICSYNLPPESDTVDKMCTLWDCDPVADGCAGPGEACGQGMDPCFTGLCLVSQGSDEGWCSALCDAHADCPEGMICGMLGVSETQSTGACVNFDGSGDACGGDPDCVEGEACNYIASPEGGVESLCATEVCDPEGDNCSYVGEECGQGMPPCYNDLCLTDGTNSWCGAVCETAADCPEGFLCGGLQFQGDPDVYGACSPAPGSGDPCGADADCATAGEACFYNQNPSGEIESLCLEQSCDPAGAECGDVGDTCGEGMPPCYSDLCLVSQGEEDGWCSTPCEMHEDCPDGWMCGGLQFQGSDEAVGACVEAPGSGTPCTNEADCIEATEACMFAAPPNQPVEAICLEGVADGAGPGEACGEQTPCFNDLCLNAGYCSAVCATNDDCAAYTVNEQSMECTYIGLGADQYGTACVEPGDLSPLCSLCLESAECAGDAICRASEAVAGETYCTLPCPNGDECPDGATCTDVGEGDMQCIPDGDTCQP